MKITVFGLGYVGSVTAVCLTLQGHEVWGVDKHPAKVKWMAKGIAPINEPNFPDQLKAALNTGRLFILEDADIAIANTQVALICVGTPTLEDGSVDLSFVEAIVKEIEEALRIKPHRYTIAVRSTIPPGTMEGLILPILYRGAGQVLGKDLKVCFNPEFLREGSALSDFFHPPFTIVGVPSTDSNSLVAEMREVYKKNENAPLIEMSYKEAEVLKVICNAFHAVKISFANEVGSFAAAIGTDPERLMETFTLDTKLNISSLYLRPGFAFGGSCLHKDIRSMVHVAQQLGLKLPLCEAILPSNEQHLRRALSVVLSHLGQVVGMAGLVFKSGTDDVRESPALWLARRIIDAGKELVIYEPEINVRKLVGANLDFLQEQLPEFRECLVPWELLMERADVFIFTRPDVVSSSIKERLDKPIIDLYRIESLRESQVEAASTGLQIVY